MMFLRRPSEEVTSMSEDEDEPEDDLLFKSKQECPCCQENITYTDEIFLVEVVEAAQDGGKIICQPITCDDGDYRYPPFILHFMCWEEVQEQIREAIEDQPPLVCEDDILICTQCESLIRAFEPFVSVTYGEIQVSQRCPHGSREEEQIVPIDTMKPVCLACMIHVIEDHFDDWESLLEDLNINTKEIDE